MCHLQWVKRENVPNFFQKIIPANLPYSVSFILSTTLYYIINSKHKSRYKINNYACQDKT